MTITEFLTIRKALIPALLSAQRHAATASSAKVRKHYERGEQQLDAALRTLDSLHTEIVLAEAAEPQPVAAGARR